jgi:hypothetical protein
MRSSEPVDSIHIEGGSSIKSMPHLKRRVITAILGLALSLILVACDTDDPSNTTPPAESTTTEPVGS